MNPAGEKASDARPHDQPHQRLLWGMVLGWLGFWALMVLVAVQEYRNDGGALWWQPLVTEGSSMLLGTLIAFGQWRHALRLDPLLQRPLHWFARQLVPLPFIAVAFVAAAYALRHAVFAALGSRYTHAPMAEIWLYEVFKFSAFYLLFTAVAFGLRSYIAWAAERLRAQQQLQLAQQAQLLQMTQQLQPHFMFNALNTIASLVHTGPDRAESLLLRLAALLRATTDVAHRPQQTLREEMALLQAYAALMLERFGERVTITWHADPAVQRCLVPTLGLQPLLENCFKHVVEQRRGPALITVAARCSAGRLHIEVSDDGAGPPDAPVFGVGLGNLQRRLQALHGGAASLVLAPRPEGGACARVEMPCVQAPCLPSPCAH